MTRLAPTVHTLSSDIVLDNHVNEGELIRKDTGMRAEYLFGNKRVRKEKAHQDHR